MTPSRGGQTSTPFGAALVGLAAMLWATDVLFRVPALKELDALLIVLLEHLICVTVLAPWILLRRRKEALRLGAAEWLCAAASGIGASALATVLFTASFRWVDPSVSILLQKLQPVVVVLMAWLFLRERPTRAFFGWAPMALGAGLVLSFPDFRFPFLQSGLVDLRSKGAIYALSAASLWALATVVGRRMLRQVPADVAAFWRFAFGAGALLIIQLGGGGSLPHGGALLEALRPVAYMALGPGLLAMLLYYSGLRRASATTATFMELLVPVAAVALNAIWLDSRLSVVQFVAGGLLLVAVTRISLLPTTEGA